MTQWYVDEQVGVWNWERFSPLELNELHVKAMSETDEQKRHEMYVTMQDIMERHRSRCNRPHSRAYQTRGQPRRGAGVSPHETLATPPLP